MRKKDRRAIQFFSALIIGVLVVVLVVTAVVPY
jgi:hypothetical protein